MNITPNNFTLQNYLKFPQPLSLLVPHIYSFIVTRAKKQEKETKRNIIKDLILMKEIQGELEKEIEQSLLNITLQGKGA